jgi:hypothetical protein
MKKIIAIRSGCVAALMQAGRAIRAIRGVTLVLVTALVATLAPVLAQAETPRTLDMKLLVISADGKEAVLPAIQSILKQIGVPFDTMIASSPSTLTATTLSNGLGAGRYQGIILTTGSLGYLAASGNYESALTQTQWQLLWQYEAAFKVRQVTLYTYPAYTPDPSNYGLNLVGATDTTSQPIQATLTAHGRSVFPYLNAANPITIQSAYTYLATGASSANPVPLLSTREGYALASIFTYPDGRQNLAMTMDGNPELTHTLMLGYGAINWVSKGVFLGSRKVYLTAQPDDLFLADDLWDPVAKSDQTGLEYRITGDDFSKFVAWQSALQQAHPNNAQIRIEIPFNGDGSLKGAYDNDTLTPAVKRLEKKFNWISHTFTHALLTNISYADAAIELRENDRQAKRLGLHNYFKDSMIQPEISGLQNPEFLRAAKDFGIRYILSDTSQPGGGNPSPNAGFPSSSQPGILVIPRHPTNLYYNVSTPAEWLSEYNYFYGPGGLFPVWDHALTYAELLDKESTLWLRYLLKFDLDPVMAHQTNMRAYDAAGHSTLGDLINATVAKYNALYALPINSPAQHEVGTIMAARMAYDASGASGQIVFGAPNKLVLKTVNPVNLNVTGVSLGSHTETYGGQTLSTVPLGAGATATFSGLVW